MIHAFNWTKLSAASALAYPWDGRRARLVFQTRPGSSNTESLIGFLTALEHEFRGQNIRLGLGRAPRLHDAGRRPMIRHVGGTGHSLTPSA